MGLRVRSRREFFSEKKWVESTHPHPIKTKVKCFFILMLSLILNGGCDMTWLPLYISIVSKVFIEKLQKSQGIFYSNNTKNYQAISHPPPPCLRTHVRIRVNISLTFVIATVWLNPGPDLL